MPDPEQVQTSSPQTGVSRVGGEVEVGYDSAFEDKWWKFEVGAWFFLILLLIATVAGVLGRGPLSKATAGSSDGLVVVRYDNAVRFRTPVEFRIELAGGATQAATEQIWISKTFYRQLGMQNTTPRPLQQFVNADGGLLTFAAAPNRGKQQIILRLQPDSVGFCNLQVAIPGGDEVRFRTLVLP